MSSPISFLGDALFYINTEDLKPEEEGELFDQISEYQTGTNVLYEFLDDYFHPNDGDYDIRDLAKVVNKIIRYLNKNKIKWEGGKVLFEYEDDKGFILVNHENIIIGIIDDEGDVEKEYISF